MLVESSSPAHILRVEVDVQMEPTATNPDRRSLGGPQCPKCRGRDVSRSHRRGTLERLVQVLSFYPYRCLDCYHRFFALRVESGS